METSPDEFKEIAKAYEQTFATIDDKIAVLQAERNTK
jgi:hypothetical protein